MSLSEQSYELIQKYLSKTLTDKEQSTFDEELKNSSFQKELLYQAKLVDTLEEADHKQLKERLLANSPKVKIESPQPSMFSLGIRIATIGLILLGLSYAYKKFVTPTNHHEELIAMYDSPYPPVNLQRGNSGEGLTELFQKAMPLYANEDYQGALVAFESLNQKDEQVELYKSNCLIQMESYDKAKNILEKLAQSSDQQIKENAEWYLAVSEMGAGNIPGTKKLLEKIVINPEHIFYTKAKELIKSL